MNYIDTAKKEVLDYFAILEPEYPKWLDEYINTPELQFQKHISVTCGEIYSKLFKIQNYSSLDHSIAVALIVWHFTHDKKQTLAALFHDIATPAFKHCVDFLDGDYMTQESTEDKTSEIIFNSKEIMKLLKRDKISIDEINDYHIYPIADNDTPKLSADRLEYSLSNASIVYGITNKDNIINFYNAINIQNNEENTPELGFKKESTAEDFVKLTSTLSHLYREDKTRFSNQFIADVLKKLNEDKLITRSDLYKKKESEIIDIIKNSKYNKTFDKWQNAENILTSATEPKDIYYVHHGAKIRYIDPLVNSTRISKISNTANELIKNNLAYDMNNYVYLDFNF